jgi:hypothetical protein
MSWPALYADIAYCTGWPIPHIRDELDVPMLRALRDQWAQFPPLPIMVAHYLGAAKPKAAQQQITDLGAQDFIPARHLPREEFDALLASMKLPPFREQKATIQ